MDEVNNSLKISDKIILAILAVVTIYFLSIVAFPKLIVTEESYGEYYWFRAPWLFVHVVSGLVATLIGWSQFIPSFRAKNMKAHRIVGKIYSYSICIAAPTAIYLSFSSPLMDIFGKISLAIVPFIWLATLSFGWISILRKKVVQHQEWMLRNYVVTFFFTVFVIVTRYMPYEALEVTYPQTAPFATWSSWAIPFFITELVIQGKKIFK